MSKFNRYKGFVIAVIAIIATLTIMFGVGIFLQQERENKLVHEMKDRELLLKDNLRKHDEFNKIKSIHFDYDSIENNNMNGIKVKGYVNNDKKLSFISTLAIYSYSYSKGDDEIYTRLGSELHDYLKDEDS